MELSQFYSVFSISKTRLEIPGNLQFPEPQRVAPEIHFDFLIDSNRVDPISGQLCKLMTEWKPDVGNFFFRKGHIRMRLQRLLSANSLSLSSLSAGVLLCCHRSVLFVDDESSEPMIVAINDRGNQ